VDLDLGQVRAFVAVVDHGHFGHAAESLNLTQQALSKRVARLERELGPLLERRRGGVEPTPAGARFLPAARRMLELADQAVADVRGTPPAPLRIDVWGELHPPARLVRAIAREQPDLTVELSGAATSSRPSAPSSVTSSTSRSGTRRASTTRFRAS